MPPSQDGHRFIEEWKIAEGRKEHPDFCFNFLPHVSSDGRHLACGRALPATSIDLYTQNIFVLQNIIFFYLFFLLGSGPDNCIALWSIKKGGLPIKTLPTESSKSVNLQQFRLASSVPVNM